MRDACGSTLGALFPLVCEYFVLESFMYAIASKGAAACCNTPLLFKIFLNTELPRRGNSAPAELMFSIALFVVSPALRPGSQDCRDTVTGDVSRLS